MRLILFILFGCLLIVDVNGQLDMPRVPRQVKFADMTLQLNDAAIKDIESDVFSLRSSEKYFNQKLDRISLYFPIIESILREEGVPEDFKYLVIQESALISDAVSTADAVGFWQFKDFTAREVGMRVDRQIDERKNIVSATRGAARYLKRNNLQYDNWAYALSAYQAGVGGARQYVNKKYFGAKKLPITKETHWYLKKYIAHKIAFENDLNHTHSEGLSLIEYTDTKGKTIEEIAKKFEVEEDLLSFYNKWLNTRVIPGDKNYTVLIPVIGKKAERNSELIVKKESPGQINTPDIKNNKTSKATEDALVTSQSIYINGVPALVLGKMDGAANLAAEAGISVDKFYKYNDLNSDDSLIPGAIYYVKPKKMSSPIAFHVVNKNESLWEISQKYGVQLRQIRKFNRMMAEEELRVSRILWLKSRRPKNIPVEYHTPADTLKIEPPVKEIPTDSSNFSKPISKDAIKKEIKERSSADTSTITQNTINLAPATQPEVKKSTIISYTHTILPGETLWSLSKKYNVTIEQLRRWNQLNIYDTLSVGRILYVSEPNSSDSTKESTNNKELINYTVKSGDNLYKIATQFGMGVNELMLINDKKSSNLAVGEILKVYKK